MQIQESGIDKRRFDIWRYHEWYAGKKVPEEFWVSDKRVEFTPLVRVDNELWVKHEDQHPVGSHKGRSLAYQMSYYLAQGKNKFVLSSSGNAAIAFLTLTTSPQSLAFVSPDTDKNKLSYLQELKSEGKVLVSTIAPTLASLLAKKFGYTDLRPSQSQEAITGLSSLGFELWEQTPNISADYSIVSVTTSGGNMLGLFEAFAKLKNLGLISSLPRLYPVLLKDYKAGYLSPERKRALEKVVNLTGGHIIEMSPMRTVSQPTSFEGNTAYQAYLDRKAEIGKAIVIFTGRLWPDSSSEIKLPLANSLIDLESFGIMH